MDYYPDYHQDSLLSVDSATADYQQSRTLNMADETKQQYNETHIYTDNYSGGSRNNKWAAMFLFVIVITTISGNVLVCLAVRFKKKLQNMFNYFLVSLALSDMLSATLVMPVSIVKASLETSLMISGTSNQLQTLFWELQILFVYDDLPLPKLMCVGWYSLDVLFTSSTICHLCMISIDRYMALTYPLRYGHAKKKKHTLLKIATVWVISVGIAGPLFILSMLDSHEDAVRFKGCGPESPAFVISATVISFYMPLLIMTVMYALTVRALQAQLREQRRMTVTKSYRSASTVTALQSTAGLQGAESSSATVTGGSSSRKNSIYSQATVLLVDDGPRTIYNSCTDRQATLRKQSSIPPVSCNSTEGRNGEEMCSASMCNQKTLHSRNACSLRGPALGGSPRRAPGLATATRCLSVNDAIPAGRFLVVSDGLPPWDRGADGLGRNDKPSISQDSDSLTTGMLSAPVSPRHRPVPSNTDSPESRLLRYRRSFTLRRSVSSNESGRRTGAGTTPDKGRRAVQVLGIIFAVFVACYLPFFAVYVIKGTCVPCAAYISPDILTALEWVAYSGSMLNPIIYHIFNPDFRRAFQNLLMCRCRSRRPSNRHRSIELPVCKIDRV